MPDRRLVVPHFREPTAQEAAWAPTILRSHSERGHWLHGVREEIEFVDEVTIRRVLSLQLEIPERDPIEGAEADAHLVPLLVFRKLDMPGQRVRVDGREAPLLRRRQNAPMAYAVLRALIDREVPATNPSDALARKLWELCHQAENPALATFSRLADVSAPGDIPIVASYPVLQLARDLAANFLVIVPITGASGSMHLVELEYRAALRRLGPAGRTVRMPWMAFGGSVVIEADAVGNLAGGGPVKAFWRRGVAFAVAGGPGARTWRAVTGRNGKAHVHVPSGSYEITELDAIRPSRRQVTADGYRRVVRFTTDLASATLQGQLRYGLLERLFHWAAIRAPQIEFPLPQIAHDLSYHIELTAPAETFISRADVLAAPGSKMASNAPWHDQVAGHLRQAHLHLDGIRRESTPHVIVRLRSEPSALLTSAAFAAVLALVVLAIVARVWDRAVGQIGPLVRPAVDLPCDLLGSQEPLPRRAMAVHPACALDGSGDRRSRECRGHLCLVANHAPTRGASLHRRSCDVDASPRYPRGDMMEPALTAAQAALLAIARQRIAELLPSRAERVGSGSVVIPSIVGEQTYGASTESSDS